jgi:chemotaxis family two-component system sensor kinase Cph1
VGSLGICVLLVEDEALIALDVEDLLQRSGYSVSCSMTVGGALDLIASDLFDVAILDINVNGELVFPVADALDGKVPFLLMSGHSLAIAPERFRNRPFITKPFEPKALLNALDKLLPNRTAANARAPR